MALKRHNFFSIWLPVRLKRYVRQKFYLFQVVPFFFEFVCFPPFFTPFSKNDGFLRFKALFLVGNRQSPNFVQQMKSLNALEAFSCAKYIQSSIISGVVVIWVLVAEISIKSFGHFLGKKRKFRANYCLFKKIIILAHSELCLKVHYCVSFRGLNCT